MLRICVMLPESDRGWTSYVEDVDAQIVNAREKSSECCD
jgi:hypothetical protein